MDPEIIPNLHKNKLRTEISKDIPKTLPTDKMTSKLVLNGFVHVAEDGEILNDVGLQKFLNYQALTAIG